MTLWYWHIPLSLMSVMGIVNTVPSWAAEPWERQFAPLVILAEKKAPNKQESQRHIPSPLSSSKPPLAASPNTLPNTHSEQKFRYLGLLKQKSETYVYLTKDDQIYAIKQDQLFDERYTITNITQDTIHIHDAQTGTTLLVLR